MLCNILSYQHIDRIQRNFNWGATVVKRKMYLVGWGTITKHREEGGFGVHRNELRNIATHACLAWKMYNNLNALWAKVLFHKNCASRYSTRHIASRTWISIRNGWTVCSKATRWILHRWIPNIKPLRTLVSGPLNREEENLRESSYLLNGHWILNNLSLSLPYSVVTSINSTIINANSGRVDNIVWNQTCNGLFSTKSAYTLILGQIHQ